MTRPWIARVVCLVILSSLVPAIVMAEDITVTTYYPSPRGVYDQLRTYGQTDLAMNGGINDNVGIGSTPGTPPGFPSQKLHIWGNGTLPTNVWIDSGLGGPWVSLGANVPNRIDLGVGPDTPVVTTDLFINNNSPNSGNTLINSGAGNVGIGLSSGPAAKLQVSSTTLLNPFEVDDEALPDPTPFVIDSAGNVGIGTATPTNKLTIGTNGSASTPSLSLGDADAGLYRSGSEQIAFGTVGSERMRIDAGGTVVININNVPIPVLPNNQILKVAGGIAAGEGPPDCTPPFTGANAGFTFLEHCADTGMYSPSNGILQFYTNSSLAINITPPAFVGGGIVAISDSLTVGGEATIGGVANDGTGHVVCIKADKTLGTCDSGGIPAPFDGTCLCN